MISWRRHRNPALVLSFIFLLSQLWLCARPALRQTDDGSVFLGFAHLPTDHYAYMMYAEQTRSGGKILVNNQFTTVPQEGRFLMVGLAAAGAVEALVPLPAPVVWHGLRIMVLALFCLVLWKLCIAIFPKGWQALSAFAFVLFSGGLDWIVRPLARDWFAASGRSWANFLDNPWNFNVFYASTNLVWAIPMTIVTAAILWQVRAARSADGTTAADGVEPASDRLSALRRFLPGLAGGMICAVLWFVHPYTAIVWGVVWAASVLIPPKGRTLAGSIRDNWAAIVGPLLVVVFTVWSQNDPVVAASNAQTSLWKLNYPVFIYPIVYGPWLILPLVLVRHHDVIDRPALRWLIIWFAAGLLMTVNPLVTGAKFQFSFFIPLALLEIAGLFALVERIGEKSRARRFVIPAVAGFVMIAALNSAAGLASDINPPQARAATTTSVDHLRMLGALKDLPDGGVLCDPYEGMLVPWKAKKPVFVGQWFLSTRFAEKADLVRWFFSGQATPGQIAGFLKVTRVRWILFGPRERAMGQMPRLPGMTLVHDEDGRQIWEWEPARPAARR